MSKETSKMKIKKSPTAALIVHPGQFATIVAFAVEALKLFG
jgi:hypothetical protein